MSSFSPGDIGSRSAGAHGRLLRPRLLSGRGLRVPGQTKVEVHVARRWPPLPVLAFLIAMLIPWQFYIGPLHLSATRAVLLIALVPCLVKWASGKAGQIRMPDVAVLLFIVWCGIATMQIEGAGYAVQSVGMLLIETAGAYFLARVYIRTEDDFYALSRALFWVMALLLPFAFLEAITKQPVLMDLFGRVMRTYDIAGSDPRWGMRRAQAVFQHPILYGVFCGIAFAPTALVLTYGRPLIERGAMVVIVVAAAFFSLSSGPMTALALQIALVCWNYVLKGFPGRWKLFWGILAFVYLFVSVFSHQSPAEHLINLVAFDKGSAWQRLLIWNYGTGSIAAHPLFGVGFGDWARMDGQTSSVDMFWIISSLRHGILAGVFLAMVYLGAALMVGFRKGLSPAQLPCRTAYLVALAGFFVAGWTVDFWGEVYTAFFFMIGSGLWLLTATGEEHESEEMPACQRNLRPRRVVPARQR